MKKIKGHLDLLPDLQDLGEICVDLWHQRPTLSPSFGETLRTYPGQLSVKIPPRAHVLIAWSPAGVDIQILGCATWL